MGKKHGNIIKDRSKDKQKERLNKLNDQIKRAKNSSNEIALIGDFNVCVNDVLSIKKKSDNMSTRSNDTIQFFKLMMYSL